MDYKTFFAVGASIIANITTVPYIIDIFRKKTTPHIYSWLLWSMVQAVAALAMIASGAGAGAIYPSVGAAACAVVFILSFRYGTKNISNFDTICLISALFTMALWFLFKNALLSIILVTIIDLVAYLPTFRKAYSEPFSETVSMYYWSAFAQVLTLFSLSVYSFTTMFYILVLLISNSAFVLMVLARRKRGVATKVQPPYGG